eukprot:5187430-Amphidinium_carterae.1
MTPCGVAMDETGALYIADSQNGRVVRCAASAICDTHGGLRMQTWNGPPWHAHFVLCVISGKAHCTAVFVFSASSSCSVQSDSSMCSCGPLLLTTFFPSGAASTPPPDCTATALAQSVFKHLAHTYLDVQLCLQPTVQQKA